MAVQALAIAAIKFVGQLALNYYIGRLTAPDGPKLSDFSVINGDYGRAIPRVFGEEAPVGGSIIELGPLAEAEHEVDGGWFGDAMDFLSPLGSLIPGPKYYTYSRSFAVVVADRRFDGPIEDVPAIWFNGRKILDAATAPAPTTVLNSDGTLKYRRYGKTANFNGLTIYGGGFEQEADPVCAAFRDNVQGYRGYAYIVVEHLRYDTLGLQSLPSEMRFLVQAKTGQSLAEIAEVVCEAAGIDPATNLSTTALADIGVRGYSVQDETTCWDALAPLLPAYGCGAAEVAGQIRFHRRDRAMRSVIPLSDMAAHVFGEARPDPFAREHVADYALPRELTVTTLDPERDYQTSSAVSQRSEGDARSNVSRQIALVQTADERAQLAETLHWELWLGRKAQTIRLTDQWIGIAPGQVHGVETPQGVRPWRVTGRTRGANGVIEVEMRSDESVIYRSTAAGVAGVIPDNPAEVLGDTRLVLIDGPILADSHDSAGFYAVVAGEERSWRRAAIQRSTDGVTYSQIADAPNEAVIGDVSGTMPDGPWESDDEDTVLTVTLLHGGMGLSDATEAELDAFVNLCWIGDADTGVGEVAQFSAAVNTGGDTWELSGPWRRGLKGTDWATGLHGAGETFVLLRRSDVYRFDYGDADWNLSRSFRAVTLGQDDADGVVQTFTNTGEGKRPHSPVNVAGDWDGSYNVEITWNRRSRFVGGELGTDAPESYEVDIYDPDDLNTVVATLVTATESVTYPAVDQTGDGLTPGETLYGAVYQLNPDRGRGHPRAFALIGPLSSTADTTLITADTTAYTADAG